LLEPFAQIKDSIVWAIKAEFVIGLIAVFIILMPISFFIGFSQQQ